MSAAQECSGRRRNSTLKRRGGAWFREQPGTASERGRGRQRVIIEGCIVAVHYHSLLSYSGPSLSANPTMNRGKIRGTMHSVNDKCAVLLRNFED